MIIYLVPFMISFVIGWFLIEIILQEKDRINGALQAILALGLGLGISALVVFFSIILLKTYQRNVVILLRTALPSMFPHFL